MYDSANSDRLSSFGQPMNDDSAARPASNAASTGTTVTLRNVSLHIGERALLESGNADFPPGQVSLIVGPSGAGKSLILRAIAGLLADDRSEVELDGEIQFAAASKPQQASVGVVFQSFALFDELSPLENVRFAAAHAQGKPRVDADALLDELGVPPQTRTSALSGGQRQRLAIARTLAYQPDVILYDEPTSGLDAASASQVARLIERTHEQHAQTSVIVTHDVQALAPIADRIFLLDPATRTLSEVPRDRWSHLEQRFHPLTGSSEAKQSKEEEAKLPPARKLRSVLAPPQPKPLTFWNKLAAGVANFLEGTSRVAEAVVTLPWFLLPRFRSWLWGTRMFLHLLRLVAGVSAWLYLAVAGAIAGYVATYFTFRFLPYSSYTEPLLIENLLAALGFALYRILVPVLVTVLIAARCGAAVTADISGKVYGQQFDALKTLGVRPSSYLLTGTLYSFLIATPVLTLWAFFVARWTSLIVFTATRGDRGPDFWQLHFHERLASGTWLPHGFEWLIAKTLCCAAGIAAVSYYQAARPKHSAAHVSAAVTRSILWGTLWVLAVHFAFAFFEFE